MLPDKKSFHKAQRTLFPKLIYLSFIAQFDYRSAIGRKETTKKTITKANPHINNGNVTLANAFLAASAAFTCLQPTLWQNGGLASTKPVRLSL